MGSDNQYEHKNFWGDINAYFIPHPDMIEKDIKPFEYKADELEIPLGKGIMAQIERGPIEEYNPKNFNIQTINEWIEKENKKDGE